MAQQFRIVEAKLRDFSHGRRHLIPQLFKVPTIRLDRRLPLLVGAIGLRIIERTEPQVQFRGEKSHHPIRRLYDWGSHRTCARWAVWDQAESEGVRAGP